MTTKERLETYKVHSSWIPILTKLYEDPRMEEIQSKLREGNFVPSTENIFRVFQTPLKNIKVVLVGQDPYPNENACGLAFSSQVMTPSLRQVENCIATTCATKDVIAYKLKPDLMHWHEQGVFLLNRSLTTKWKASNAHAKQWKFFTDGVVNALQERDDVIWMLWGRNAQQLMTLITNKTHHVLTHSHPAAAIYGHPFDTCTHFNDVNKICQELNIKQIQW